jgi:predicted nuclease with TOPRIM domain
MEQNALLEKQQSLIAQIDDLDTQLTALQAADPLYIKREQLQAELDEIQEQLETSEEEEARLFKESLVEQGYTDISDKWSNQVEKDFENYSVTVDIDSFEVYVYDSEENELWTNSYYSYDEVKEALETLVVETQVATLTIRYPFVSINDEAVVKTPEDLFGLWSDVGFYDLSDIEEFATSVVVE